MNDSDDPVIVEMDEGLAVVRLNRPERLNSFSPAMLATLATVFPELIASPAVRAIMITGTGRAFCAGGDIGGMAQAGASDHQAVLMGMQATHAWLTALRCSEKLVLAAVNGVAAGGGFGLAMIADVVVASDSAYFKSAFSSLGAAADFGLAFTLPRTVGTVKARQMLFEDRRVSTAEALQIGLIDRIFPAAGFADEARQYGRFLASRAKGTCLTKRLMRVGEREALELFFESEAQAQLEAFQSHDFAEGLTAYRDKRQPVFTGS